MIIFGNFTGSELKFINLNIEAELQSGNLICFQSKHLFHGNNSYEGVKHSLIFFINHEIFFDCLSN
jgi:hypothetical protein